MATLLYNVILWTGTVLGSIWFLQTSTWSQDWPCSWCQSAASRLIGWMPALWAYQGSTASIFGTLLAKFCTQIFHPCCKAVVGKSGGLNHSVKLATGGSHCRWLWKPSSLSVCDGMLASQCCRMCELASHVQYTTTQQNELRLRWNTPIQAGNECMQLTLNGHDFHWKLQLGSIMCCLLLGNTWGCLPGSNTAMSASCYKDMDICTQVQLYVVFPEKTTKSIRR